MAKPKMKRIDLSCAGGRVRKARIDKSLTIDDLSKRIEISSAYLGMIERGERNPPDQMLTRIAEATGTPIEWLKNGDMENTDDNSPKDNKPKKADLIQNPLNTDTDLDVDTVLFLGLIMREEPPVPKELIAKVLCIDQDDLEKILNGTLKFDLDWEEGTVLARQSNISEILKKLRAVESFLECVKTPKKERNLIRIIRKYLSKEIGDKFTYTGVYDEHQENIDIKNSLRDTGYPVRQFAYTQETANVHWIVSLYSELSGPLLEQLIDITKNPEEIRNNENEAIIFIEEDNYREALFYVESCNYGSGSLPKVALMCLDLDSMGLGGFREI